jgi:hypothetical protein
MVARAELVRNRVNHEPDNQSEKEGTRTKETAISVERNRRANRRSTASNPVKAIFL